jgi:hypothetical protein
MNNLTNEISGKVIFIISKKRLADSRGRHVHYDSFDKIRDNIAGLANTIANRLSSKFDGGFAPSYHTADMFNKYDLL